MVLFGLFFGYECDLILLLSYCEVWELGGCSGFVLIIFGVFGGLLICIFVGSCYVLW